MKLLADFACGVDSAVRVKQPPILDPVEGDQSDREEHLAFLLLFAGSGLGDFSLHPGTVCSLANALRFRCPPPARQRVL